MTEMTDDDSRGSGRKVRYQCEDCDQCFWVESDAPQVMDGFEDVNQRAAMLRSASDPASDAHTPLWPKYGLNCPWCAGWCWTEKPQDRAAAARHPDDDPNLKIIKPSPLLAEEPADDTLPDDEE